MLRSAAKWILAVAAVTVVAGVAAGAWLLWRLGQGPLAVPALDRHVESALSAAAEDLVATIERTVLVWPGKARVPEIHVLGARFTRGDGTTVGTLPEISVRPSGRALLRGRFEVARIGVAGVRLLLARDADGRLRLGGDDAAGGAGPLLGALFAPGSPRAMVRSSLQGIRIRDAAIRFEDRPLRAVLQASAAELDFERRPDGFHGRLRADFSLDGEDTAPLGGLSVPVSAVFSIARDASPLQVGFAIEGGGGHLALSRADGRQLRLRSLAAEGTLGGREGTLEVRRLRLETDAATLEGSGRIGAGDAAPLEVTATVGRFAISDLDRLWPATLAPGTRAWVGRNVGDGAVERARLALRLPAGRDDGPLPEEAVTLDVEFTGLSVDYLRPMPPLRGARGSVRVTGRSVDVRVAEASAAGLRLERGTMKVDLESKPPPAEIEIAITGNARHLLALIQEPPLGLRKPAGLEAVEVDGPTVARVRLRFPIRAGLDAAAIDLVGGADLEETSVEGLPAGVALDRGRFEVAVKEDGGVSVSGSGRLRGPAEGRADLVLDLDRSAGDESRLRLEARGDGLDVDARATFAAGIARRVEVRRLRVGRNDLTGDAVREGDGWRVSVGGAVIDLEPMLRDVRSGETSTVLASTPFDARLRIERATTGGALELDDLTGRVRGDGRRLSLVDVHAALAAGGSLRFTLSPEGDGRRFALSSDDAGAVLETLGILEGAAGGHLDLRAALDAAGRAEGRLDLRNVRVTKAPVLARVLSAASLGGAADLMRGDGILFTRARLPFTWDDGVLRLRDGRAVGSLGLTADGTIDRGRDRIDLAGDLFPAYTLNAALGGIPFVGPLVVGKDGEGVFGIRYRVKGRAAAPDVQVNPLSALAPGILRQMFVDPFSR